MVRSYVLAAVVAAFGVSAMDAAIAQDTVKVGIIVPMTGVLAPLGKQLTAAANLYVAQHGTTVAGKNIELIIKDDSGVPDNARRLAQELVINDQVNVIGAGVTPSALAIAPIVTQGKVATVIMLSGTSIVTERSPYFVRTSFTLGQSSSIIAEWAAKNGSRKVVIIQSDYPPGDAEERRFHCLLRPRPAGRLPRPSRFPSAIRTSRRPWIGRAISTPTRCSCSCQPPARPAPLPGNLSSAASTRPASS